MSHETVNHTESTVDLRYLADYAATLAGWAESGKIPLDHGSAVGTLIRMKDLLDGVVARHVPAAARPVYWDGGRGS